MKRPSATVRVLRLAHVHPEAVRIEIDSRYSTTGITMLPSDDGARLSIPQLITNAAYAHEERCGQCDTSQAHREGDQVLAMMVEEAHATLLAERAARLLAGRRN